MHLCLSRLFVSRLFVSLLFVFSLTSPTFAQTTLADETGTLLARGDTRAALTLLDTRLESIPADAPDNATVRFGLATVTLFRGVETLAQGWHRYGLRTPDEVRMAISFLRLPIPTNPDPQVVDYQAFREILAGFLADLRDIDAILEPVGPSDIVTFPLDLATVRLDLDGDGNATDAETLPAVLASLSGATLEANTSEANTSPGAEPLFSVDFDTGDALWLRGYANLLSSALELYLAYDSRALFESTAHYFFPRLETPHDFLRTSVDESVFGIDLTLIADVVAAIHLSDFPVDDPTRLERSLAHLETVLALSQLSWQAILAEEDDAAEWLPNPNQTGALGVGLSQAQVDGWLAFLDEAEQILAGDLLVPYWRVADGRGVNVRRVFTEPTNLDLILWFQGSAVTPYLETGTLTDEDFWFDLQRLFNGNFIGFALWIN